MLQMTQELKHCQKKSYISIIKIVLSKIQKLITCAKNWASHASQTWKEKQVLTNFSLTDAAADFCCRSVE